MAEPFFRIEMLPARHGDSLWIEYGKGRETNRVLIDGGPVSAYDHISRRIHQMPRGDKVFELIVLTHVDADHVEGLVRLFADTPLPFSVRRVWFNGWRQIKQSHGLLGSVQAEFLSALLVRRASRAWDPDSPPVLVPNTGKLPVHTLPGGMKLTLLSPSPAKLDRMAKAWQKAVDNVRIPAGNLDAAWKLLATKKKFLPRKGLLGSSRDLDKLIAAQFLRDQTVPNGSSIAFLAEYERKSALFLADAHPDLISRSLQRLCAERKIDRLDVDAVKVSHHGSKKNTNESLLKLVRSPSYLISTNGDQFSHPDEECIARILKFGRPSRLYFNYLTEHTRRWTTKAAEDKHRYKAVVRPKNDISLVVSL